MFQDRQIGTSSLIWRCFWRGKWHASCIMLKNTHLEVESDAVSRNWGKLAHSSSFTWIVLELLSGRYWVTDTRARPDTCFLSSLKFKCSSCVNTDTWGNQLAVCVVWVACEAVFTHKPLCPCLSGCLPGYLVSGTVMFADLLRIMLGEKKK